MSSYLTIYGVPKNEGKPIDIVSFSRSHCIYSAICDDPLRILRGIRFSITKGLRVSEDMWQAMKAYDYLDKMPVVSEERIREELTKCFKCNSSLTLGWLSELTDLRDYIFKNTNLWLKPTSEK